MYPKNLTIPQEVKQLNHQRPPKLVILIAMVTMVIMGLVACQPIQVLPEAKAASAASATTSEEAANKALISHLYEEVFNRKNLSVAGEVFAPNFVIHQFDPERAAIDLDVMLTIFPDLQVTVERLVVEDDMVTAMISLTGTHQVEYRGIPPTGNLVTVSLIDLFRFEDGKVVELWHNVPVADMLHQMEFGPNTATGSTTDPSMTEADLIRNIERERLRASVEADMEVIEQLHADDFQLINPGGGVVIREEYLEGISSGFLDYNIWELESEIDVRLYGSVALIRHQSLIDIIVAGEKFVGHYLHTVSYEKRDGRWQAVWSQATEIE